MTEELSARLLQPAGDNTHDLKKKGRTNCFIGAAGLRSELAIGAGTRKPLLPFREGIGAEPRDALSLKRCSRGVGHEPSARVPDSRAPDSKSARSSSGVAVEIPHCAARSPRGVTGGLRLSCQAART